jgi:putative DNA primase/helicase
MTTLDQAIAQMRADGMPEFPPGHPKIDAGRITRYGPKKNAWYVLHSYRTKGGRAVIVGAYGYWGKLEPAKIEVDWKEYSAEERVELEQRAREQERAEQAKREDRAKRAANRAHEQWRGAVTAAQLRAWLIEHGEAERELSGYLKRKGVEPEACRFFTDGTVLVPMVHYDATDGGKLAGLQKIAPDGEKRFNNGMAKDGAACRLGAPPADGDPILITEGYATGLSIREAILKTLPVFVAFDAGNLKAVAQRLRARYPLSPFIFCADDDWKTTRADKVTPWNPGLEYAQAAAREVGYSWVIRPLFLEASREPQWTDFNDLHAARGLDEVRTQLNLERLMSAGPGTAIKSDALPTSQEDREIAAMMSAIREWREDPVSAGADGGGGGDDGAPPGGSDTPSGPGGEPSRPKRWHDDLQRGKDYSVKPTVHNAVLYLTHHKAWDGVLGYDTFSETVVKLKAPPFGGVGEKGEWTVLDDHRLLLWFSRRIGEPSSESIEKAVQLAAHRNEINPLRARLEGLAWDKQPRLATWLSTYLGVNVDGLREQLAIAERSSRQDPDAIATLKAEIDRTSRYVELVGIKWMVAAVARVFEPGCRVDYMLILEGEQGVKKSTTIEILGGEWYTDARLNFADKDSLLIVQGRWIIEMAELEGMNKAETSETKKFLTQHIDLFRPPYGRKLVKYPRRCVFAGTVNLDAYLKDDSGNRRFWPVRVTAIDADALRRDVDQLWAEAVNLYRAGTPWWVLPDERHLFAEQQEQRFAVDAWEDTIIDYLDGRGEFELQGAGTLLKRITIPDLMQKALKLDKSRWDRQAQLRVVGVLRRHGWVRRRETTGSRAWYYERPAPPAPAAPKPQRNDKEPPRYDAPF